jgi:peptidoglycan/xylan/chitin deacetylase (PgdA/CDA1 family)
MLRAAVTPGVSYGSHTWTHPNLTRLPAPLLAEELERPLAWLRHSTLPMIPWLAYPYGLTNDAVTAATGQAGYEGAVLVEGGWMGPAAAPFALPRYNVPAALSEDGFMLRLSGVIAA